MVPVVVDPLSEQFFYDGEINHAPDVIECTCGKRGFQSIAVAMQIFTFSFMPNDAVRGIEFDPARTGK